MSNNDWISEGHGRYRRNPFKIDSISSPGHLVKIVAMNKDGKRYDLKTASDGFPYYENEETGKQIHITDGRQYIYDPETDTSEWLNGGGKRRTKKRKYKKRKKRRKRRITKRKSKRRRKRKRKRKSKKRR